MLSILSCLKQKFFRIARTRTYQHLTKRHICQVKRENKVGYNNASDSQIAVLPNLYLNFVIIIGNYKRPWVWSENSRSISSPKTYIIAFIRKRELESIGALKLQGINIHWGRLNKYLGITFNSKLTWINWKKSKTRCYTLLVQKDWSCMFVKLAVMSVATLSKLLIDFD